MRCDTCENKSMCKEREYLINFMHGEIADTFADNCSGYEQHEEPMTNEEWFCKLSTEEKARFLACEFTVACDDYAYSNNKETWHEKYWVAWLKEKHVNDDD